SKFGLTINDNDLNLNPLTQDSFTVTFSSTDSSQETGQYVQSNLGSLTLKAAGAGVDFHLHPMQVTFVETGPNTGLFSTSTADMSIINAAYGGNGLKDGDQIEFKYHDHSENPVQTSTTDITVGNPPISVNTDRTTIPNPVTTAAPGAGGGAVKFTIT